MTLTVRKFSASIALLLAAGLASGCSTAGNQADDKECVGSGCTTVTEEEEGTAEQPQSQQQSEEQKPTPTTPSEPAQSEPQDEDVDAAVGTSDISIPWVDPSSDDLSGEPAPPTEIGLLVTGLRMGEHQDFDRVVIDLDGDAPFSWEARWVAEPVEDGRGQKLDIGGKEFLDIRITNTRIPESDADYEIYDSDYTAKSEGDISALYDGTFEGRSHVVIGMNERQPVRIFQLGDPTRLVIDVKK